MALASSKSVIRQGYICREIERTVRVRIKDDKAYLTIKGMTVGDTRAEYEYSIPVTDAGMLLDTLCIRPIVEKTRYIVEYKNNKWEIDVFEGHLKGLTLAEIELPASNYNYDIPPFIGRNVTNDPRYYNANLALNGIPSD